MRSFRFGLWLAVFIVVAAVAGVVGSRYWPTHKQPTVQAVTESVIKAEFSLIDHTGRAVTSKDFRGRWLLVFYGFTNCPDVCPTALNTVAAVIEALGPDADKVAPIFITVDPARDTAEVMAGYVAAFDPRIIGLTGTEEQVAAALKTARVYYAKVNQSAAPGGYTMDHSSYLYLFDPKGMFDKPFSHETSIETITATIRQRIGGR